MPAANSSEHDKNEEQARQIEGAHELRERNEGGDAVLADCEGHGAAGAHRRHAHDHADHLEEHVRTLFDHVENQRASAAELVQSETEENGKEKNLQNFAFRKGADHRVRDDVHDELGRRLHFPGPRVGGHGRCVERARVHVHTDTRLDRVDDRKPDDEGDRRDHFKVEERQAPRFPDRLHVFHAGDARHHRAKDDGSDDHLDQTDESVAEGLHFCADFGHEGTEQNADDDRADHLKVQHLVDRRFSFGRSHEGCSP